ncbi:MAG: hypothetical protein HY554_11595 [Elusimicrobia bacterium]|nr:hypothetical protein [Elusimicrobiota bacterium]
MATRIKMKIDLQCGACSALTHQAEPAQRFCPCCGAGFERFCIKCRKKVEMYFEEWWPEDDECLRTYSPAKRCPTCNSGLEVDRAADKANEDDEFAH